ncbi:hypothetical protein CR513_22082, partial [Mucuna pruriens]
MEDKTSRKGSTLILGRPFLMTVTTKIDVHARTLSMEFSDILIMSAQLVSNPIQVSQSDPKAINDNSSSPPPPIELKPLSSYLKYAYMDTKRKLLVIIANNL